VGNETFYLRQDLLYAPQGQQIQGGFPRISGGLKPKWGTDWAITEVLVSLDLSQRSIPFVGRQGGKKGGYRKENGFFAEGGGGGKGWESRSCGWSQTGGGGERGGPA